MKTLLLCAAMALACSAAAASAEPAAPRIDFSSFTLTNGLTVLVSKDSSVPVVAVTMIVNVGGRTETRGRSGFAHLFEHMMFEGSKHVPKGGFDKYLESVGGDNNASTHEDFTFYYEELPSNALATALWLDADRIGALSVTPEAVKNQIAVVEEEKRSSVDNEPYGPLEYVDMGEHSFSNWQNAHPVIGSFADLDAASIADVRAFFAAYYSPDNITMAIVGDVDPAEVRSLVNGYFGPIPAKPRPKAPDATEPAPDGESVVPLKDAHAKLPAVAVAWKGMPARGTTDYYALVLLGRALVGGKSARLYQTLVKESQSAVSLDGGLGFPIAGWDEYKAPALFGVMAVRKPEAPFAKVRGLIAEAAKAAGADGLSASELERVKIKFRSDWVRAQETRLGRATRLLQDALLDGDAEVANEELGRYMSVTNDDIRRAAAAYLKPEAATWFDVAAGGAQ
ncbi:MAG TPA: pitrilysin family protein [Elusimicrobiota bacterium]|nr:pitrilysin family protein [Elusimicrobiota bacterium]